MSARTVEAQAIRTAMEYAAANGHANDQNVIGCILAGMVIGAICDDQVRLQLTSAYVVAFPDEAAKVTRWAQMIDEAAKK